MTSKTLRVPKSMPPGHAVFAFRYGVAHARASVLGDYSAVRRHSLGYVQAPSNVMRLADRVRIETIRRLRDRADRIERESLREELTDAR